MSFLSSHPVRMMWETVEVHLENLLKEVFVSLVLSGSHVSSPLANTVIPGTVRCDTQQSGKD